MTVYSGTIRLAEKIAERRQFAMKYDYEIPVHDVIGRQQGILFEDSVNENRLCLVTKPGSVRNIVQQLDARNWRALDYFRMVENKSKLQAQNEVVSRNIAVRI